MRKRLNTKGLTIIELLVCFVIVAIIAITLLNTVMEYKSEEQIENTKNYVESYKNTVSRVIQGDITDYGLRGIQTPIETKEITIAYNGTTVKGYEISTNLIFTKKFYDDGTGNPVNTKKLTIVRSDIENYIMYPDVVKKNDSVYEMQDVKYELESTSKIYDIDPYDKNSASDEKKEYNDLRFGFISDGTVRLVGNIFYLDIPIIHSELGEAYHIKIVAPLNLLDKAIPPEKEDCTVYYYQKSDSTETKCNPNTQTILYGNNFTNLCVTTKTGNNFGGWYTAENCKGEKIDDIDVCSGGMIYVSSCWTANKVKLKFKTNTGTLATEHGSTITVDSENILVKGNNIIHKIDYGEKLDTNGLIDYNNPTYINIEKRGYLAKTDEEWIVDGGTKTYSQKTQYKASDFCDAKNSDCEVTLKVNWIPKTLKVIFNKNDGTANPETKNQTFTYDVSGQRFNQTFTRTGYQLLGWAQSKGATTASYSVNSAVNNDAINTYAPQKTIYAVWKAKTIVVTFNKNDGSANPETKTQTLTYDVTGQKFNQTFTRTGYNLVGWAKEDNKTQKVYEVNNNVTNNWINTNSPAITLYAVWEPKTVEVTFDKNDGTSSPETRKQTFTYGVSNQKFNVTYEREGYELAGWGETRTQADDYYYTYSSVQDSWIDGMAPKKTLYAMWSPCTYTVKFYANGGSGSMSNQTHTYGTSKKLSKNTFTKTGYRFAGWTRAAGSNIVVYTDEQSVKNVTSTCNGTVNLYAVWEPKEYTLKVDANGGTMYNGSTIRVWNTKFTYGKKRGISSDNGNYWNGDTPNRPIRDNYEFAGWTVSAGNNVYKENDGSTPVYYIDGNYAGNLTVTAQWTYKPKYTLSYDGNSGTVGSNCSNIEKYSGEKWGALCSNISRSGYDFVDWRDKSNTADRITGNTVATKNTVAKANWSKCESVGNWSNTSGKIKISSFYYSPTAEYYKNFGNSNDISSKITVTTRTTWESSNLQHYRFKYHADGDNYYHDCNSKFDNLKPHTPEVWNFGWDTGYSPKPSGVTVSSTCEPNSTRTTAYTCDVNITTPSNIDAYHIAWSYNFDHDQDATYVSGSSGRKYEYCTYTYENGNSCSSEWNADYQKYKDSSGNYTIQNENDICSAGYTKMVCQTEDRAGNKSSKLTVNFKWNK